MAAIVIGQKGRWVVATVGAIVVVALMLILVRLPTPVALPASPAGPASKPAVQLANPVATGDVVLREEMELRDPRPLFLPTRFNATLPEPRLEAGRTFLDNETLKLGFAGTETNISKDLPPVVTLNGKPLMGPEDRAKPVDILVEDGPGPAAGLGRNRIVLAPLPARGGYVEAVSIVTGKRVLAEALPLDARPPGDKPWEPMEFRAMLDAAGLAAPLTITASSRVEDVDVHYRNYLVRKYRIGERLPAGFYRITVAP